jgi:hypothetical protein
MGRFETVGYLETPSVSRDFLWKPPSGSITSEWYLVSFDMLGRLNTIVHGTTPRVDLTVGSTSQLDFTAAKLSTLNQSLLRVNEATGLFEPYGMEEAIVGALQVGGGTNNGTCSTANSGANTVVTRLTGGNFSAAWVGKQIYINGNSCLVLTRADNDHLTVKGNLGTLTGVNWSQGRSPQFKIYDRSNALIGFWGDDSPMTPATWGYGLGKNVRLGGPDIAHPILDLDSFGNITLDGAVVRATASPGGFTTYRWSSTRHRFSRMKRWSFPIPRPSRRGWGWAHPNSRSRGGTRRANSI